MILLDLALTAALLSFCVWALVRVWRARHGLDFDKAPDSSVAEQALYKGLVAGSIPARATDGPDFNHEVNLHADTLAERFDLEAASAPLPDESCCSEIGT